MGFFGTFSTSKVTERKPANHSPNKITGTDIYIVHCAYPKWRGVEFLHLHFKFQHPVLFLLTDLQNCSSYEFVFIFLSVDLLKGMIWMFPKISTQFVGSYSLSAQQFCCSIKCYGEWEITIWHTSCCIQNTENFIIQLTNDRTVDKLSNIPYYQTEPNCYRQYFVTAPTLGLYN